MNGALKTNNFTTVRKALHGKVYVFDAADFDDRILRIYNKTHSFELLYKDNVQLKKDFRTITACLFENINLLKRFELVKSQATDQSRSSKLLHLLNIFG